MVVVGHKMAETFLGFREFLRLNPLPKLFTDRGPKPFGFAYSLWMVRAGNHVLDTVADEKFLKVAFSSPGEILAALVCQHFLGFSEALTAIQQGLDDNLLFLVQVQPP